MIRKLAIIAIILVANTAFAQGSIIGVLDADVVIQESVKGKAFFEQYERIVKQKREELKVMMDSLRDKQKDAQARQASWGEEKKQEVSKQLASMATEIKHKQEDAQRESQKLLNDKLDEFRKELGPLIKDVAKKRGLDVVFNRSPTSDMVYHSEKVDITKDVIKAYNALP